MVKPVYERRPRLFLATALFAGLTGLVCACHAPDRTVAGSYEYIGSGVKARLELHEDHSYRFCTPAMPCETAKFDVETWSNAGDRIFFGGPAMRDFTAGGWANLAYGAGCPCISFQDPDSGVQFVKVRAKSQS